MFDQIFQKFFNDLNKLSPGQTQAKARAPIQNVRMAGN
jgi:hypothetical protein